MKIPELNDDLSIVSKLGDNPGTDDNLTAEGLKAKFDEGSLVIQRYLNSVLVAKLNQIFAEGGQISDGLIMAGPINMNQQMLFGLKDPANDSEPVNLGFAKQNFRGKDWMPTAEQVGARPATWVPTIAEIGAAPAWYGLGDTSKMSKVTTWGDLNVATVSGWYKVTFNTWYTGEHLLRVDATDNTVVQTFIHVDDNGKISIGKRSRLPSGSWGDLVDCSPSAFAPAGYGYGGKITTKIYNSKGTEADFNAMLENVFASMSDETAMQVQFLDASTGYSFIYTATLYKSYSDYGWLKGTDYGGRNLQKIKREGTWQPWEWFAPAKKMVWETASRTSSFEPQTLSLDLSAYDEVLIYSCLEASQNNDYIVVSRCPVGERALAHFSWGDDGVSLHRFAKTSKTGIEFFNAYHGGAQDNSSMMPYKIYGIKKGG